MPFGAVALALGRHALQDRLHLRCPTMSVEGNQEALWESGIAQGLTLEFVPHSPSHFRPANDLYHHWRGMAALQSGVVESTSQASSAMASQASL